MHNTDHQGNAFSRYHPLVIFAYFCFVLIFTMFFLHPICLLISLSSALAYAIKLKGRHGIKFAFAIILPMFLICVLINPIFNHQGLSVLAYFPNGNPLTLESTIYGIAAATMLTTVICWFTCYNAIMTSDKFIYLFGRIIPAMSLILSMTLSFVPRFFTQAKIIANAQRCLGRDITKGPLLHRIRLAVKIISILITWSLENSIETSESMKSRGYGLPKRTSFALYRWQRQDKIALSIILISGAYVLMGAIIGASDYQYFPTFQNIAPGFKELSFYIAYLLLCTTPLIIQVRHDYKWEKTSIYSPNDIS